MFYYNFHYTNDNICSCKSETKSILYQQSIPALKVGEHYLLINEGLEKIIPTDIKHKNKSD